MTTQTPQSDNVITQQAQAILRQNDRGGYTIPTDRLYPYQWNWDSAFVSLGFATFDLDRAWKEIETLFEAQWPNGMVPHIVFRADDPNYFPGPSVYGVQQDPPTSGYTQPPVATSAIRWLYETDHNVGEARMRALFSKCLAWHRWFHRERDPDQQGFITITHPWEARDNAPDWDKPFANIDVSGVGTYQRRDLNHVDVDARPKKFDYDRYLTIVKYGRENEWDQNILVSQGPFRIADPGITFILHRADRDLQFLAATLGETEAEAEIQQWLTRTEQGVSKLWNPEIQAYTTLDLKTGEWFDGITCAAFLAFYAGLHSNETTDKGATLIAHLERILSKVQYGLPGFDPDHPAFEPVRYWRGPVWAIINYMAVRGLEEQGYSELAQRIRNDTGQLIRNGGFPEHFSPVDGAPCGGKNFTWTAAMWLAWFS